jgi:hypothetical protein
MLKAGDVIKDNDPRMKDRKLTVIAVGDDHAICDAPLKARVSISLKRIFDDGKTRRTGFSVVRG